jgi:hypothetical protein
VKRPRDSSRIGDLFFYCKPTNAGGDFKEASKAAFGPAHFRQRNRLHGKFTQATHSSGQWFAFMWGGNFAVSTRIEKPIKAYPERQIGHTPVWSNTRIEERRLG